MYQACIFDLDGTLANTLDSIVYFANSALERCGYSQIQREKYKYLVGNGADRLMRGMLETVCDSYSEEEVHRLRGVYDGLYEADPLFLVENYTGVPQLIQMLKKAGLQLAVLSNKPHNVVSQIVKKLFPDGTFDLCYGQREGVPRKPSPQGALMIAQELKAAPQDCLYIGDTDVDMKTGKAAGMSTVGVLWGFRDRPELEENHARYLVAVPEEIYKIAIGG